jgi:hypothetical protein
MKFDLTTVSVWLAAFAPMGSCFWQWPLTAAGYEKYCRELRQKLVHDLEARSRNRTLAEYMASYTLASHGLPICKYP